MEFKFLIFQNAFEKPTRASSGNVGTNDSVIAENESKVTHDEMQSSHGNSESYHSPSELLALIICTFLACNQE